MRGLQHHESSSSDHYTPVTTTLNHFTKQYETFCCGAAAPPSSLETHLMVADSIGAAVLIGLVAIQAKPGEVGFDNGLERATGPFGAEQDRGSPPENL